MSESAVEPTVQERLDAIRQRVEKATEGPWRNEPGSTKMGYPADESETRSIECKAGYPVAGTTIYKTLNDAEFIANARRDIPFLLSLLDHREAVPVPHPVSAAPSAVTPESLESEWIAQDAALDYRNWLQNEVIRIRQVAVPTAEDVGRLVEAATGAYAELRANSGRATVRVALADALAPWREK